MGAPRQSRDRVAIASIIAIGFISLSLAWVDVIRQIDFERRESVRMAIAQNDDRSVILQQFVSRTLNSADLATSHIASLYAWGAIPKGSARRPGLIQDPIATNSTFLGLSVVDERGDLVASTVSGAATLTNVHGHPAFAIHRKGDDTRLFISRPMFSRRLNRETVWISRRLNHPDGRFAGVVAVNLEPRQFTTVFGQSAVSTSQSAWVVGLDGIIRARLTGGAVTSGQDVSHGELFLRQRKVAEGRFLAMGTLDRRLRFVSHRRVPGHDLFVSYSELHEVVLRKARQRAQLLVGAAALASAVGLLFAAFLIMGIRVRTRQAQALVVAKARLEEAQRVAQIGDWTNRFSPKKITWSPQLYEMYERDPALGPLEAEFSSMLAPESVELLHQSVARIVQEGAPVSWDMQVRLPSGRIRHHLVSAVPTRDRHGSVVGFHGTTQDVTELKRQEALLSELAQLSRVGAMNALAATLSHELNQPLTAARNHLFTAQLAIERLTDEGAVRIGGLLRAAGEQIGRTGQIIQRMRNLVARGDGERELVSVDQIMGDALEIVMTARICPYEIEQLRADGEILVRADAIQIQQVIFNLIRNACEAQDEYSSDPIHIEIRADSDRFVRIQIKDHGPGFVPEMLDRLTQAFASSKETGLGLGLTISRTIVEAHRGALGAQNCPNGGAIVWFTLPMEVRDFDHDAD